MSESDPNEPNNNHRYAGKRNTWQGNEKSSKYGGAKDQWDRRVKIISQEL